MKHVPPEAIYNEYRKQIIYKSKGFYPRKVVNFRKIKESKEWFFYEQFSKMVNNNDINYVDYIRSLVDFYEWFPPKLLIHRKSILIYNMYRKNSAENINPADAMTNIASSINFMISYFKDNNIHTLDEYLDLGIDVYPVVLQHISKGFIKQDLVVLIPGMLERLKYEYPKDCVHDACNGLISRFKHIQNILLKNEKILNIKNNFENVINKLLK
jgi:hypothetical protein